MKSMLAFLFASSILISTTAAIAQSDSNCDPDAAQNFETQQLCELDRSTKSTVDAADPPPKFSAVEMLVDRSWELSPQSKRGLFKLWPHRPNYLLPIRHTNKVNPQGDASSSGMNSRGTPFDATEIKFQLSIKFKVLEEIAGDNGDLWFAYTQQSHYQRYNRELSYPFRENNYQPEAILAIRTKGSLLGWSWRYLNIGALHESNGRSKPFSRSWNRLYAQFAFTHKRLVLQVRPWYAAAEDVEDNGNIRDYYGSGDARLSYVGAEHVFSIMGRYNLSTERGALQFDWAFPIAGRLKGYFQVFSGYGESLLDYDHEQTTVGLGVLLTPW